MKTFAGIDATYAGFNKSRILLQSVSYDGTSTWGKGAEKGFRAFIRASENMELYDIETDTEVYRKGIHVLPEIPVDGSPETVYKRIYTKAKELLSTSKFLTFFGGEHSISIGIMQAFYEKFPDITILQLDAHADLRPSYLESEYNHACALHRASKHANLVQIGICSMDSSEKKYLNPSQCFLAEHILHQQTWMEEALDKITEKVYITLDLDVFDPSIMPSTGTPEPGGLDWYTVLRFLKKLFQQKDVLGFDLVELAPIKSILAPDFLAAKLYYKMLSYKFNDHE